MAIMMASTLASTVFAQNTGENPSYEALLKELQAMLAEVKSDDSFAAKDG